MICGHVLSIKPNCGQEDYEQNYSTVHNRYDGLISLRSHVFDLSLRSIAPCDLHIPRRTFFERITGVFATLCFQD